jgi:uncharacterized OB-fold protein
MQQTTLTSIPEAEATFTQVCPICGHVMPEQLMICWYCGYCLNRRLVELSKGAKK